MIIAIIEKYPILKRGLIYYLRESFSRSTVIEFGSTMSPDKSYIPQEIDLIILGLNQNSSKDYIFEIANLKNRWPNCQLIVYDEKSDPQMVLEYLRFGASGYLAKDDGLSLLSDCIKAVLSGKRFIGERLLDQLQSLEMDVTKMPLTQSKVDLTLREYQIAKFLSEGKSTTWIANNLNRKASTISTTKFKIFKKLNVDSIVHLKNNLLEVKLKTSRLVTGF